MTFATPVIEEGEFADTLTERLRELFASSRYRPPVLPTVAVQIMELAQRPGVPFEEVVGVLEKDPLLAARVLSISSSSLYAGMREVVSLKQAAVRLGLKTLRDIVLEAAMHLRVFRVPGYEAPMERLRRHSTATAQIARVVCRRTSVDAEHAFICGLLHDVGFAAGMLALVEDKKPGDRLAYDDIACAVAAYHEEATGIVANLWKLPAPIVEVVSTHHRLSPRSPPLVPVLVVAEQLAYELDQGLAPAHFAKGSSADLPPSQPRDAIDANPEEVLAKAKDLLRVDEEGMASLRAEVREVFLKMQGKPAAPSPGKPHPR